MLTKTAPSIDNATSADQQSISNQQEKTKICS